MPLGEAGCTATAVLQGGTVAGLVVGGLFGDRLRQLAPPARFWLVAAGLLLCAPAVHAVGNSATLAATKIAATTFGVGCGLAVANFFPSALEVVPQSAHATAVGILNLLGGLVSGFGSQAGALKKSVSFASMTTLAGGLCVVAAGLLVLGTRRWFAADAARAAEGRDL